VLCIIQARYSSKRLPGKVLKKILGITVLQRVVNQIKKAKKISKIIVATSKEKTDKKIIKFCNKNKIHCISGSLNNVFKRFYSIIIHETCKSFVRISADSPLMDPCLIGRAVTLFKKNRYDIVTNVFPRTFPKGFSIEVINSKIILDFLLKIKKKKHKEHLTSFFYDNYKNFKIKNFYNKKNSSDINLSIDNFTDFIRVKNILKFCKKRNFSLDYILFIYKKLFNEK
jgi:spore coat polysaccharide biosynthesis protein SpsF (cytidylyltransferase family)